MPNGGPHHCYGCCHHGPEEGLCKLRGDLIESPRWTTCSNWNRADSAVDGPVCAIVCEVKGGNSSYCDIPYFDGHRPYAVQNEGSDTFICVTDATGEMHEFSTVIGYLAFYYLALFIALKKSIVWTKEIETDWFCPLIETFMQDGEYLHQYARKLSGYEDEGVRVARAIYEGEPLNSDTWDTAYNSAFDVFNEISKLVLGLEWDGGAPGYAGAAWIKEFDSVYIFTSSDASPSGPYKSLKEAMESSGFFGTFSMSFKLFSSTLDQSQLEEIARDLVNWDDPKGIVINSVRYEVQGDKLVRGDPIRADGILLDDSWW